jgi:uncharacterized paraquat-inducible protein A
MSYETFFYFIGFLALCVLFVLTMALIDRLYLWRAAMRQRAEQLEADKDVRP